MILSSLISTPPVPPRLSVLAPLNSKFLYCFEITGSKTAPSPFPPSIVTERTLEKLVSCGSTCISLTDPLTTGLITALAPVPIPPVGAAANIVGGLITS